MYITAMTWLQKLVGQLYPVQSSARRADKPRDYVPTMGSIYARDALGRPVRGSETFLPSLLDDYVRIDVRFGDLDQRLHERLLYMSNQGDVLRHGLQLRFLPYVVEGYEKFLESRALNGHLVTGQPVDLGEMLNDAIQRMAWELQLSPDEVNGLTNDMGVWFAMLVADPALQEKILAHRDLFAEWSARAVGDPPYLRSA